MYIFGSLMWYLFLFYVYFYKKNIVNSDKIKIYLFIFSVIIISWITLFTPLIIPTLHFNPELQIYYEWFWSGFFLYQFLYLFYIPTFVYFAIKKFKKLSTLDKKRFQIFLIGYGTLLFFWYVFLVILPAFNIWMLEKQQILYILPLILAIFYNTYRYNFIDLPVLLSRIFHIILAFLFAFFTSKVAIYLIVSSMNPWLIHFWWLDGSHQYWENIFIIFMFLFFYFLLGKFIFIENKYEKILQKILKIRKNLSYFYDIKEVNRFLSSEFWKIFHTNFAEISLFETHKTQCLKHYFDKYKNIFINDIVFLEENKNKFEAEKILFEIHQNTYLVFPLRNISGEYIGHFELWKKYFWDIYTKEEIDIITDFCEYLVDHIKYIQTYKKLYNLNITLDKKVDEKTILFNSLLNKQTDFIAMASHEIKNPLWAAIFQLDSLIDEFKHNEISWDALLKELEILNTQLLKVWNLTKNIFSVQKYDMEKINLHKQNIDIIWFFYEKIEIYKKLYANVEFIFENDLSEYYYSFDKIHFEQVIDNLVNNALRFIPEKNGKIIFCVKVENDFLHICVIDNGPWFQKWEELKIFEKYSSWDIVRGWIGMGLYLCKKIIEIHEWNITAKNNSFSSWAQFDIILPLKK